MAFFTDEDAECPTVGEFEDVSMDKEIYWHIPNVLSMPSSVDFGVDSPVFTFANATWCLQMYPRGQRLYETENCIDLQLVRRESLVVKHEGFFKLDLKIIPATKLDDFSVEEDDHQLGDDFSFEPNRCVYTRTLEEYYTAISLKEFVPPHDCFRVKCQFLMKGDAIADEIPQPVRSASEMDNQWFSIGDCDDNPTVGVIKDYEGRNLCWFIPSIPSTFKHARMQSPHFSVAEATWCLRIHLCEEGETAKVAIVRLNTNVKKNRSQELKTWCIVKAHFIKKSKTLKKAEYSAVIKKNNTEHDVLIFENSQKMIESCVSALAVTWEMWVSEIVVEDDQLEPDVGGTIKSVIKLLGDFKRLLLTSEGSDVNLLVKGQNFAAHSAILRARSSVFNSMLIWDMKEERTGSVDIEDCDPGTFSDFLHFLYCGSVEDLSSENVFNLYRAADKYDVRDLKWQCVAFMQRSLTEDTFCDTVALSLQHGERELLKLATEFFAKNYPRIILTVRWQQFIIENPIQCNELFIKALLPARTVVPEKASKKGRPNRFFLKI